MDRLDTSEKMLKFLYQYLQELRQGWIEETKTFDGKGNILKTTERKRFSPLAMVRLLTLIRKIEDEIDDIDLEKVTFAKLSFAMSPQ